MTINVAIAQTMKAARLKRRFSQRELAEMVGVPRTYVSKLETGMVRPYTETLARLAGALSTSLSNIIANAERRQLESCRLACGQNGSINQSGNQDLGNQKGV